MECIVYFDVIHESGMKELRGLIFLHEDTREPSEQDYLNMFADMGYDLRIEKRQPLVFVPVVAKAGVKEIRIRRLDTGSDEEHYEDRNLKNVVSNLLPNKPNSI